LFFRSPFFLRRSPVCPGLACPRCTNDILINGWYANMAGSSTDSWFLTIFFLFLFGLL
jgi:hypothetical protein